MIKVDECEPIGELEAKFPYRDVQIKRGVNVNEYYDLEAEIGRGKFGTVYLCREKVTNLSLAAKFVGIKRRQDRRNVEREVEIMRTLQHPRLIQLYDAFETDNTMVVVLELIEGGELFERVIGDDFILTEKACTIFMRQICEGVAFIHKNNIIHLDLKPENILCLTKTGNRIKIIDFGLARHYEPGSKLQVLFGTPEFVAPEVVNFDQISPATDMWSVGVICYVLLSGLSPFMGDTDVETMTNVTLSRYDFDDESFDNISENAKDFITNLLLNSKESRLTADQCLEHPWLKRKIPPPPPELITTKENLKSFVDNYHNINVLADNNMDGIINRKPSALSAVELIAASDKEFMNRDGAKSFSNKSNENIFPPVRFPVVMTNNNVVPVTIDDNLSVINVPNTNDEVLNMVNANVSSMPSPPMLDNATAMVPNIPIVPNNVPNLNQIVQVENENENNNVLVASTEKSVEILSTSLPLADIPPRVIAAPDVPIAHLPFISKSLPAAAAMLDESMVHQLKPLHIPLIPSLPIPEDIDEPIIVHPPVIGTTLPPKRGSIDVDLMIPQREIENMESAKAKSGSIDAMSLIPKRRSIDVDQSLPKRDLMGLLSQTPTNDSIEGLPQKRGSIEQDVVIPPIDTLTDETTKPAPEPTTLRFPMPIPPTLGTIPKEFPLSEPAPKVASPPGSIDNLVLKKDVGFVSDKAPQPMPISPPAPPELFKTVAPATPEPYISVQPVMSPQPVEDVFVPQPPPVVKVLSTSPVSTLIIPPPIPSHEIISHIKQPEPQPSTSFQMKYEPTVVPNKPVPYTPTTLSKAPTSPITTNIINPPRRESPLQKTLDEIPKISSEILLSFTNMPSLSKTTNYESTRSKISLGTTRRSTTESSTYSSYDKVSSPRGVSLTEHNTSSYTTSVPPNTYPKIQGIRLGRSQSEEKSAFANVGGRGYSSSIRRSEVKEIETSRQSVNEALTRTEMKNATDTEAPVFKTRLRSTAPWFSERKAESEANIEKRSTDMSALLKETLGPLELRGPWAREIRQISAKLVELSKDTIARKQQDEEHLMEMNKQARRQKFKVSVLNRDVVFGAAREFYLGGEVPVGSPPLKEQILGKNSGYQSQQSRSTSLSPRQSPDERKSKPTFKTTAK